MYAYKYVPLSLGPMLEACGYIFVTVLGVCILKEKVVPTYLLFSYYMSALSQAQKEQYWTEINDSQKKFALNNSAEGRINMAESIEDWRLQIFG